tara:strand:- start:364 stop:588 length:225 start_codon:yes stop_codon:yes gene_type:complete
MDGYYSIYCIDSHRNKWIKMNKKAYAFFLKKNRRKNPIAKALKFFTPKVIRDKKKYRRKDVNLRKREVWDWTGD